MWAGGGQIILMKIMGEAKEVHAKARLIGGIGACSPRKSLSFIPSELVSVVSVVVLN